MGERRAKIYYDDDCGFCRRTLRVVLRIDVLHGRRLMPAALQEPAAASDLAGMSDEQRMRSWHLVVDGEIESGGDAFAALAELWELPVAVSSLLRRHHVAVERAYQWVADRRVMFGRLTRWMPDLPTSVRP